MTTYVIGILILGVFVGLVSGMFGLGGGGIIVPVLLLLLPSIGVPKSELMFMAMGTSFATMIISTSATAYNQYRSQNIDFTRVKLFLPALLLTVLITSQIVTSMDQNFLKLFFSLFLVYFGVKMLIQSKRTVTEIADVMTYPKTKNSLAAIGIGVIATLGGVSGAGLIVPFFNKTGLNIKKAIGTAAFCGVFLTIFAAVGFIVSGLTYPDLPPYSLGFIHLPTVLLISILSVPMTKVGVKIMLKISDNNIKRYFALFLIALSLYLIVMAVKALIG
ncbi:sulfite exporter TauE/SafE family protein [Listeria weihenstephanensis]|uniref:Probable membrane transporter protein n=1 Tax=Listeria weihenstephanensis TaxID=1006155 RepID=A0A841Z999_9LIST|nr:sulfite exporter TauE/SafE family protein [Listeria weihenstephanensis]MBC1501172.1 sulfite exporter TauE/SafE family protein [Listeria weihenstephanensis]